MNADYEYTTVDYTHPNPRFRSRQAVAIHDQIAGVEIVSGRCVEVRG